jgi:hypothetical protein
MLLAYICDTVSELQLLTHSCYSNIKRKQLIDTGIIQFPTFTQNWAFLKCIASNIQRRKVKTMAKDFLENFIPNLRTIRRAEILEGKFWKRIFRSHLKHLQTIRRGGVLYSIFQEIALLLVWKIGYLFRWQEKCRVLRQSLPDPIWSQINATRLSLPYKVAGPWTKQSVRKTPLRFLHTRGGGGGGEMGKWR